MLPFSLVKRNEKWFLQLYRVNVYPVMEKEETDKNTTSVRDLFYGDFDR